MVRVKVCGLTSYDDAIMAEELGADALGFIFADSKRRITPEAARGIIAKLPPFVHKVGVFVDEDIETVLDIIKSCSLTAVQLHGNETARECGMLPVPVIKSFRVGPDFDIDIVKEYDVAAFLLDTYDPHVHGGTGKVFDWSVAKQVSSLGRLVLSGGLNPDNITEAVKTIHPYAVDVCSGVESSPGKKDQEKLKEFIKKARTDER